MKIEMRALPWRTLVIGSLPLAIASMPSVAAEKKSDRTPRAGEIVCATPDMWTGAARISRVQPMVSPSKTYSGMDVGYSALVQDSVPSGGVSQDESTQVSDRTAEWRSVYWGPGLGSSKGAARARIARKGVLWGVDPAEIGLDQKQAGAALLRAGASMVFYRKDGKVVYRAPATTRRAIADRAAAGSGRPHSRTGSSAGSSSVGLDVAMMRVEAGYSSDPLSFIDALPEGMFVYPYGTGFVVHVPRDRVEAMWNAVDGEGRRVLLVGASGAPSIGTPAASNVLACGGTALSRRFPTPKVLHAERAGVMLDLGSQRMSAGTGDVVMVVQSPPYGRGMEMALIRVVGR